MEGPELSCTAGSKRFEEGAEKILGIDDRGDVGLDLAMMQDALSMEPFDFATNPIIPTISACSSGLETPISMRMLLVIDTAAFSISSMFRPSPALDIFGDGERRRCTPDDDADEDSLQLFDLHLRGAVIYAAGYAAIQAMPFCTELTALMEQRGHPLSLLEGDQSADTPWGIAKAYIDEINAYLTTNDGWNADGSMGGREANLVPFSDFSIEDSEGNKWKGYTPKNTPYKLSRKNRWQPLLESDGLGYITAQEHVTPHIGITGRFFGFETAEEEASFASRRLDKPSYRKSYKAASRDVLEETRLTATDPVKQWAISFFDNKFSSLIPLKIAYFLDRRDSLDAMEFYKITVKAQLAIYNGVLLAWREKIRHDAPRPPSVIKRKLGDELVETYAGPDEGVGTIKAEEWQPFIRTMPHSDYKAASRDVLEETRLTATDPVKQWAISFFDNKFSSLIPLKIAYFLDRRDSLDAMEFYKITVKIRHDAPRPPSVIKRKLGDELVETYAGPDEGVGTIKAEEWQPFIRTMPHSEYPSASACLCEAFTEQIRFWLDGRDEIEPPLQFPPPELGGPVVVFSRWSEISEMCGQSRVWGGMHFEGAVPAGAELCGGGGMAESISNSIDALLGGDASAAVFKRDAGELMVRPL
eukprot:g7217.t1